MVWAIPINLKTHLDTLTWYPTTGSCATHGSNKNVNLLLTQLLVPKISPTVSADLVNLCNFFKVTGTDGFNQTCREEGALSKSYQARCIRAYMKLKGHLKAPFLVESLRPNKRIINRWHLTSHMVFDNHIFTWHTRVHVIFNKQRPRHGREAVLLLMSPWAGHRLSLGWTYLRPDHDWRKTRCPSSNNVFLRKQTRSPMTDGGYDEY